MKQNNENQAFSVWFGTIAAKTAGWVGSAWAFILAVFVIVLWGAAGPYFHYSDTWQLVINTATTVITFLVVFLIQNTQNRDARALHLKLDEVIRAIRSAHNEMISIEHLSDGELEGLTKHYERLRADCGVHFQSPVKVDHVRDQIIGSLHLRERSGHSERKVRKCSDSIFEFHMSFQIGKNSFRIVVLLTTRFGAELIYILLCDRLCK